MMMTASLMLILGTSALTSCGDATEAEESATTEENTETHDEHADHAHYACPMDCEKGKVYDEEGKCPVCKMNLEKVES